MLTKYLQALRAVGATMRAGGSTLRLFPSVPTGTPIDSRSRYGKNAQVDRIRNENGWARDAANLRSDWVNVGKSLEISFRRFDQR